MKKRLMVGLLCALLIFSVSCSKENTTTTAETTEASKTSSAESTELSSEVTEESSEASKTNETEAKESSINSEEASAETTTSSNENSSESKEEQDMSEEQTTQNTEEVYSTNDEEQQAITYQLSEIAEGDVVVTIKTSMGNLKIKLFPEQAPKTVENFVTHAKNGYYDGQIFHRVINNFMIQGGDPTGTGMGGESIWGGSFADEIYPVLFPYRGALCMANAGPNTNGSQFFVVQSSEASDDFIEGMQAGGFPQELIDNYQKLGGTPWLYGKHTVFGQLVEGYDVLDAIAAVEVGAGDKPVDDVVIETITVEE